MFTRLLLSKTQQVTSQLKRTVAINTINNASLKSWKEIPGPSSLPVIGQLHHFLPGGELQNFAEQGELQKLFDKYGPMVRFEGMFGVGTMVFIGDPELSEYVLRSENSLPIRPGFVSLEYYRRYYKNSKGHNISSTSPTGLMTDQGEVWKQFRSAVNPVLLQPKTINLYCNVLDEVALDMIKRMKVNRDEKNQLRSSFDTEMNLWALESIATVALGCRLNCLNTTLPENSPEKQLIQCIHNLFTTVSQLDFRPNLWKYISTPLYKKAMALYERHENLTKHFLIKGIEQLKQNGYQKSHQEQSVLEKLMEINEEFAYIIATDMLFAGIDTTANAITAILYLLASHQDKQDKLRKEILSKTERKYLKACVKETLRLMPIVSGNLRKTSKEYHLMSYRIPKHMNLIFAHREMSLMDEHYPRAKEFIPERWLVEKTDPLYYGNTHPFVYAPFGFSARSCIGRRIAELEIETFLARIIENFKVEWFGPPPKIKQTSVNYIMGPYNFIFTDV